VVGFHAVTLWQLVQFKDPVEICVPDLPAAAAPLWQLAQLVEELKVLWSGFCVDCQLAVEIWQLSQLPVTPLCTAVLGFCVAPSAPAL
jgi:hypothetical protein